MSANLSLTITIQGGGTLRETTGVNPASEAVTIGASGFPALQIALTNGTGDDQANQWYAARRTLANGGTDSLDLNAVAGGLTNKFGQSLVLTKVRALLVVIDNPDGTKAVTVGPQNVANAWQGPFLGTGAQAGITVKHLAIVACGKGAGLGTVTPGTGDLLVVKNNSGVPVDYYVWPVGVE